MIDREEVELAEWERRHPVLAAIAGGAVLAFAMGGMVAAWVAVGACKCLPW
jgi:hypothetical protein